MKLAPSFAVLALLAAVPGVAQTGAGPRSAAPAAREEARIEGVVIPRADGSFLGLTLQDGRFRLAFYDRDKRPRPADVPRAVARWPNVHGPGQNRTVLNPVGDGTYLLGAKPVRPPLSFRLILTLVSGREGDEGETYTVDFRG